MYGTEYCKKIQEKEIERRQYYGSSSEEDADKNSSDEDDLHHPFKVREAAPIIMDIPVRSSYHISVLGCSFIYQRVLFIRISSKRLSAERN